MFAKNQELVINHADCAAQFKRANRVPRGFNREALEQGLLDRSLCSNPSVVTREQCAYLLRCGGMKYCGFDQEMESE